MFTKKNKDTEQTVVEKEIESIVAQMQGHKADTPEYKAMVDQLEKLYKLKLNEESEKKTVSPDALVAAGASIAGIVMILGFEKANVLTSKAMQFVFKPRA